PVPPPPLGVVPVGAGVVVVPVGVVVVGVVVGVVVVGVVFVGVVVVCEGVDCVCGAVSCGWLCVACWHWTSARRLRLPAPWESRLTSAWSTLDGRFTTSARTRSAALLAASQLRACTAFETALRSDFSR